MTFFSILLLLACNPSCVDTVGVRQRIAAAAAAAAPAAPDAGPEHDDDGWRRRGGVKRRIARASGDSICNCDEQHNLHKAMRIDWARGDLKSKQVQRYAAASGDVGLERLAKIANSGRNRQNLFRDLKRAFGYPPGAPDFDWIEVQTKKSPTTSHPVLFPHRFFQRYHDHAPTKFRDHLAGRPEDRRSFWESLRHTTFVRDHERLDPDDFHNTAPLGMHADAGAYNNQDSVYVISWNGLLATGSTVTKRFVFSLIRKSEMTSATLDQLLTAFAWSINILSSGKTPEADWMGRPLSGGGQELGHLKAVLCQIRGDWQFYQECCDTMGLTIPL